MANTKLFLDLGDGKKEEVITRKEAEKRFNLSPHEVYYHGNERGKIVIFKHYGLFLMSLKSVKNYIRRVRRK